MIFYWTDIRNAMVKWFCLVCINKLFPCRAKFKLVVKCSFFFYDTIKITILLVTLIYLISYIQSYFPPEKTKRILTHFNGFTGNIIAALLGTVTPFCSCSSVPIFIGFTRAGLPVGMTFSFLISSPMVDVASMLMLMSFLDLNLLFLYSCRRNIGCCWR